MSQLPVTFELRVKERVQGAIADLIPDEELGRLVAAQIDHFRRNDLPNLIKSAISAELSVAIKAELEKPEYKGTWSHFGQQGAGDAIKAMIVEMAPAILAGMIGGAVQQTVYNLQSNINRF